MATAWPPDWKPYGVGYHQIGDVMPEKGTGWMRPPVDRVSTIKFATSHDDFIVKIRNFNGEIKTYDWSKGERKFTIKGDVMIIPRKPLNLGLIIE